MIEIVIQILLYVIDLDERGEFRSHVEDENGVSIFEITNEDQDEDAHITNGGIWLVEAGYMKHAKDINGLHQYLKEIGVAKADSKLSMLDARAR